MGAFREQDYSLVGEELLVESIQNRLKEKDCNAGVIFDNLHSKYSGSTLIGLKVIMQAID
jgi:adenylate kinase family enzyme